MKTYHGDGQVNPFAVDNTVCQRPTRRHQPRVFLLDLRKHLLLGQVTAIVS